MYFCRQYIAPQENYRDRVTPEILERRKDHPLFATLMSQETCYGWEEEGPDMEKVRANPAGRSWHA